jgi:tetratricopeptide (TPR) repeat protein
MFPLEEKCYRRLVFDEEDEYLDYIQQLDSLLVASPSSCHLLNNRGVAFYEIGEHDRAATDLQAACVSATTNTPFLNLAEIEAARGSHQLAIQLASKAIEIDPTDYSAYATRAGIYQEAGLHAEAETDRATVQKLRR